MNTDRRIQYRSFVILALTLSAINWLIFTFAQIPFIVPPGGNSVYEEAQNQIALRGLALFFVSFAGICLMAGMFGKQKRALGVAAFLFFSWLWASWGLYPKHELLRFPWRLAADIGLLLVLGFGTYLLTCQRRETDS